MAFLKRFLFIYIINHLLVLSSYSSTVILDGTGSDKDDFIGILNDNTIGGEWGYDSNFRLYLNRFTSLNFFASYLYTDILSLSSQTITLKVGHNISGVLFGAFQPQLKTSPSNGIQILDLADISLLPINGDNTFTQAGIIAHELFEVQGSLLNNAIFHTSHSVAIDSENFVYLSQGATGFRLSGHPTGNCVISTCFFYVPWKNNINPLVSYVRLTVVGASELTDIQSGIFDTGVEYIESGKDISFTDISVVDANFKVIPSIPIPAAIWLFGSGLLGLIGFARRKKA